MSSKNNKSKLSLISRVKKSLKMPYVETNGYKYHYNPSSVDARNDGFSLVHRDVAREKVGGEIYYGRVVHHIDGNKLNNDPKNLTIMKEEDHLKLHNIKKRKTKKRK